MVSMKMNGDNVILKIRLLRQKWAITTLNESSPALLNLNKNARGAVHEKQTRETPKNHIYF